MKTKYLWSKNKQYPTGTKKTLQKKISILKKFNFNKKIKNCLIKLN